MRGLRRAALAIGIGALLAAAVRLRGSGGTPVRAGGWRELGDDELGGSGPFGADGLPASERSGDPPEA